MCRLLSMFCKTALAIRFYSFLGNRRQLGNSFSSYFVTCRLISFGWHILFNRLYEGIP
jgi:hypothetical protein